jgi:hypothetical protein
MRLWHGLVLLVPMGLLIGCSRAPVSPTPAAEGAPNPSAVVSVVKSAPEKKIETPVKDIAQARNNPEILRTNERGILCGIVRQEGRAMPGVAGAVLWVTPANKTTMQPPLVETVCLSVEQGEYRPHVVLAQKGGILELRTVDERADFQASGAATFSETIQRGEQRTFPLASAGLIAVHSQLQPRRLPAYVWVLDGVPRTLTGSDGQFRLPPLSAGEYELVLWHEDGHANATTPRTAHVRLTLGANDGAEVRWTLPKR